MPKYKVLRPIEHNLKLYLPEVGAGSPSAFAQGRERQSNGARPVPPKAASVGHGMDIPVDASGTIELTDSEAAAMTAGQIEAIKKLKVGREVKS